MGPLIEIIYLFKMEWVGGIAKRQLDDGERVKSPPSSSPSGLGDATQGHKFKVDIRLGAQNVVGLTILDQDFFGFDHFLRSDGPTRLLISTGGF